MPNPQLIDYIGKARASGIRDDAIRSALLGAGWRPFDVDEAFGTTVPPHLVAASRSPKVIVAVASVIAVFLLGGGGYAYYYFFMSEQNEEPQPVEQEQVQEPTAAPEESIRDILAKAKNIGSVQYDRINSMSISTTTDALISKNSTKMTVWQKLPSIRFDSFLPQGITMSVVVRPDGVFQHSSLTDEFIQSALPSSDAVESQTIESISGSLEKDVGLRVMGTEVIEGVTTTVVSSSVTEDDVVIHTKTWIWNDKGIPIKSEAVSQATGDSIMFVNVTEYKNFVFGDIPDSIFEIPPLKINDDTRKSNAQAITIAIMLYASEQNLQTAPAETDDGCPEGWMTDTVATVLGCLNLTVGTPALNVFLKNLPTDTMANTYVYSNQGNDSTFCLGSKLETPSAVFLCNSTGCSEQSRAITDTWSVIDCPEE